ncbi:hypothetical protein DYB30_008906, partial [Aphanomyces astaci]
MALDRLFHICRGDIRRALHMLQVHGSVCPPPLSHVLRWTSCLSDQTKSSRRPHAMSILAASAAIDDKDLLYNSYLQELGPHYPHGHDKKADQVAELDRLDAMADSLSLCDSLWTPITTTLSHTLSQ